MSRTLLSGSIVPGARRGLTVMAAVALGSALLVAASAQAEATPEGATGTQDVAVDGSAHVDNPFLGSNKATTLASAHFQGKGYVNPEWSEKAKNDGGSAIANQPTGVWLDRIAAIEGTDNSSSNGSMGLRDHLDAALEQGADYAQFVIYDLPGRDCAALASNGELGPDEIDRYKQEYIDPIAEIQNDSAYADLRIINIIEIDSLPNLVTNVGDRETATPECDVMLENGNYQEGISYALSQFTASNVYNYIDAAHHGWIGWDDNFKSSASLFADTAKMADGGVATVDGFIVNTANYSATKEPFIKVTEESRKTKWIDWNRYVDETTFAKAFRKELVSAGFNSKIGMLIDTSRNGWGGSKRPTKASTSSNIETFVEESRIDR
ncbi:MAG: Glucanase, partial [Actinomycetota bacterium]|nr:Glucanase [Actinomycetota bacterium]